MLQFIEEDLFKEKLVTLYLLRLDLLHQHISGNKWYKLKYNIAEMQKRNQRTLLTFGGAYSNHIAATAYAGKYYAIKTIGVIRGEEQFPLNPTLNFAKDCGMQLHYISREDYKQKNSSEFLYQLKKKWGNFYLLPEGGANQLGLKGCKEIVKEIDISFQYITCACGTGTTLAGIISSLKENQYAIGFSSLKGGNFLADDIRNMLQTEQKDNCNWHIETQYHFGGYAKMTKDLTDFILNFKLKHCIQLDPIYTAKMMVGIYDQIQKDCFPKNSVIIAVHSGGLQGIKGMEERLGIQL